MKFLKYLLLFFIPFVLVTISIVAYFRLSGKFSNFIVPPLPSISLNDVIKFSRFSLEKAPSETLVGSITQMSGEIKYEPRLATESARIEKPVNIQQGDILETGTDGSLTLNFKNVTEVLMDAETMVNVVQTLPANLVFWQTKGAAEYKKLSTSPVSVRALHLLIEPSSEIKVSFDTEKPVITVTSITGKTTIAFNNLNIDTRVINLEEGSILTFNDATRRTSITSN